MKLEIDIKELQKKRLFISVPMYGGQNHGMFMKSSLDLQGMCQQNGIETRFSFIFNESLITRARNYLVDEFLRSEFTHLLFIDSDIHFNPQDVIAMLAMDKDVCGAPYPKKSIKWASVLEAVKRNPSIDLAELEKVGGDYVFNAVAGTGQFAVGEPLEVMEIGTGFMMVKKEVFPKWEAAYPEFKYKPDHVGQANFDGSRYIHAYFDTYIDVKKTITYTDVADGEVKTKDIGGSDRYLSEDYMFCQFWRNIGGKIWLCPWMKTHHIGSYAFTGDMQAVAQHVGAL